MMVKLTFWNVDYKKGSENPGPSHCLYPGLDQTGVNANIDECQSKDDDDHDVFSVLPKERLLAEEKLVRQSKHEKPNAKYFKSDLQQEEVVLNFREKKAPTVM